MEKLEEMRTGRTMINDVLSVVFLNFGVEPQRAASSRKDLRTNHSKMKKKSLHTTILNLMKMAGSSPKGWKHSGKWRNGETKSPFATVFTNICTVDMMMQKTTGELINIISIYSQILLNRLTKWSIKHNKIIDNQFGFQKGKSTIDRIFLLHSIIIKTLASHKKLYCVFIDCEKMFR